jgi:hypothetical protein
MWARVIPTRISITTNFRHHDYGIGLCDEQSKQGHSGYADAMNRKRTLLTESVKISAN